MGIPKVSLVDYPQGLVGEYAGDNTPKVKAEETDDGIAKSEEKEKLSNEEKPEKAPEPFGSFRGKD